MQGTTVFTQNLVKSREKLQVFSNGPFSRNNSSGLTPNDLLKYEIFQQFLQQLWSKLQLHFGTKQTTYAIKMQNGGNGWDNRLLNFIEIISPNQQKYETNKEGVEELITILKQEYPGVDFTYKETTGYDGTILERVIIMDWS
jgi:hypothetical protein